MIRAAKVQPSRGRPPALLVAGAAAAAIAALVVVVLFAGSTTAGYSCDKLLAQPADASATDGFVTAAGGSQHVAPGTEVKYASCPPASGPHYNAPGKGPLRPAFYGPDSDAGPAGWVHNLEHGYVVAAYRCDEAGCPSEETMAALRRFAANGPPTDSATACGFRSKVLVVRFDDMATSFALLAWNRVLLLDEFDTAKATSFAARWIEREAPEPRAC